MRKKKEQKDLAPGAKLAVFKGRQIRRTIHNDEWWFSVIDVVEALTGTNNPRRYWSDLKRKLKKEGYDQLYENIVQLKLVSVDGKKYATDCSNTETMFRLVQSIPSPKAEPFKRWLARVGYERVKEIEDPELATKRTRALYKAKGYSDAWIEKRMRGIAIREELTDEWQQRGIQEQKEYAILTAEISKAAFDMTPSEYKKYKGLKRENLRDHMNDLELKGTLQNGLFAQYLRYAQNLILGISNICLRLNFSHALTLNENSHFSRYPYFFYAWRGVNNRDRPQ